MDRLFRSQCVDSTVIISVIVNTDRVVLSVRAYIRIKNTIRLLYRNALFIQCRGYLSKGSLCIRTFAFKSI